MRRILLLLAVAAMLATMMVVAGPAFATIHPLAEMERAVDSASAVVQEQDPPGLTPGTTPGGGADEAQPVQVANTNAFKDE
jgi:ABC-type transport system substrate-binding protein